MCTWILIFTACGTRAVEALPHAIPEAPFAAQRAADQPADPIRPAVNGAMSVAVALQADPDLELSGFRAEVERNAGHVQRCWEARAADLPVQDGAVSVHAQIDPAGAVAEQCLSEDSFEDPGLRRCVNDLIAMGRYPEGAPGDVTFTLRFSAPN